MREALAGWLMLCWCWRAMSHPQASISSSRKWAFCVSMPEARPSTSDFQLCDPAWFDWLVSLWGIASPVTFVKRMPGASWAFDPHVALGDGSGLGWGHRETFNRFNQREFL